MKIYERVAESDEYTCTDCNEHFIGSPTEWEEVGIAYSGNIEEFDLDDAIYERTTYLAGECGCDHEDPEHGCFDIIEAGQILYVCGECEATYIDEHIAIECCK